MKKLPIKKYIVPAVIVLALVVFFSFSIGNYLLPRVNVATVQGDMTVIETLPIQGQVVPKKTVEVTFGDDIIIEEFIKKPGSRVRPGDALFRINKEYGYRNINQKRLELEKQLQEAKAYLASFPQLERSLRADRSYYEQAVNDAYNLLQQDQRSFALGYIDKDRLLSSEAYYFTRRKQLREVNVALSTLQLTYNEKEALAKTLEVALDKAIEEEAMLATINEDGVYYATDKGVLLDTADTNVILPKNSSVMTIALADSYDDVWFYFEGDSDMMQRLVIGQTYEFFSSEDDANFSVRLEEEGYIMTESGTPVYGAYEGITGLPKLKESFVGNFIISSSTQKQVVNLSSLRPAEGVIAPGAIAYLYVLEPVEDLLGGKYMVKEVPVAIVKIGDAAASITSQTSLVGKSIVALPDYRIQDGVEVFMKE